MIWPVLMRGAVDCPHKVSSPVVFFCHYSHNPPSPEVPALFDTTVRFWRSGRREMAVINVSAVPHSPNPAERTVVPLWMSWMASSALSQTLWLRSRPFL